MAEAYLATVREKKRGGGFKTALAVSPTWAEASKIAAAVSDAPSKRRRQAGRGTDRSMFWSAGSNLSGPQKADDAGWIGPGDLLTFHQNVPGYSKTLIACW